MQVALVTGGARGIGRAIACNLADGYDVAVTHNTTDPGPLLSEWPDIFPVLADLSNPNAAQSVVDAVISRFGRIDVLVNNAGTIEPDSSGIADIRRVFDVNAIAPMALLTAALPHMKPGASVINISSTNAVLPAMGAAAYSASKAALNTWTRGMAKELGGRGIRVNAVAPGATERAEKPRPTELIETFASMTALGRVAQTDDIAKVVRFMASDAAGFITGEIVNVNGGYRL